jgi:hypothetical protein
METTRYFVTNISIYVTYHIDRLSRSSRKSLRLAGRLTHQLCKSLVAPAPLLQQNRRDHISIRHTALSQQVHVRYGVPNAVVDG